MRQHPQLRPLSHSGLRLLKKRYTDCSRRRVMDAVDVKIRVALTRVALTWCDADRRCQPRKAAVQLGGAQRDYYFRVFCSCFTPMQRFGKAMQRGNWLQEAFTLHDQRLGTTVPDRPKTCTFPVLCSLGGKSLRSLRQL